MLLYALRIFAIFWLWPDPLNRSWVVEIPSSFMAWFSAVSHVYLLRACSRGTSSYQGTISNNFPVAGRSDSWLSVVNGGYAMRRSPSIGFKEGAIRRRDAFSFSLAAIGTMATSSGHWLIFRPCTKHGLQAESFRDIQLPTNWGERMLFYLLNGQYQATHEHTKG